MNERENGQRELRANELIGSGIRLGLATELGQTGFNDDGARRNHFEVFGWPREDLDGWDEENWLALYLRNAYAKVVNDKPALTTWRDTPTVEDRPDGETQSEFEQAVVRANKNHNIWSYGERVDRAAGIGQHGLLLVGFSDVADDVGNWDTDARDEFSGLDDIVNFKPITESQIDDIDYGGPDSERWGKPESYSIDLSDDIDEEGEDDQPAFLNVHWTRVVDVPATRLLDDETLARPRAEPVLNNLLDIEKTMGAAAEAAYRAADYGLHVNADPEKVDFSEGADELRDELQRYEQELQRYIRTQGVEVNRLGGDIQDPSGIVETNLDAIAAETGIPKNELRGNQRGEVSGAEQDEKSYFGMIAERREQYATPHIVRGLIDLLVAAGVFPEPQDGSYTVSWPDLSQLSESEQADIESKRAQVIASVPGLAGDEAIAYLKNGSDALPEVDMPEPVANVDETAEAVQAQFWDVVGNQDRVPPEQAAENARRGLECVEAVDTDAGKAKGRERARQIIDAVENNTGLSPETISDIASFDRHREQGNHTVDEEHEGSPCEDNGYVSWKLWGGSAGVDWAQRVNEQLDND